MTQYRTDFPRREYALISRGPDPLKQLGAHQLDVIRRYWCDSGSNYGMDHVKHMNGLVSITID